MSSFKLFWNLHKWTGIALAAVFAMISVTGFMLLIKKKSTWIQPPTMKGTAGEPGDFITPAELFDIVLGQGHADFATMDDIDRVDFRPGKRIYKVQSTENHAEIQIDAVTGDVLHVDVRRSDFIENLHDGSFFSDWVHGWIMPVVAFALLFLTLSGLWLWIEPKLRRRRRLKKYARV